MADILTVDHLTKEFGRLKAVDALSFEVREGEILGMMGPNGAGKTTVFNLLTGVFKPDEGTINFKGKDIGHESPAKRCHRGIGRRKRLELGRALATQSDLILLDEIAGGLTEKESEQVLETVKKIWERGITIIWIEHILTMMSEGVDRLLVISEGRWLKCGDPHEVMRSKEVLECYLGAEEDD